MDLKRIVRRVAVACLAGALATVGPASAEMRALTLLAPASPGGGWDQTARAMQAAFEKSAVVPSVQVENVTGAGGTIGLAQFVGNDGARADKLLVSGLIMVGGILTNRSPVTLEQVTPIARLTGEYEMIAVPTASPVRTMGELAEQLKASPGAVSWGGGSAGGTDHMLVGLIANAVGVDPRGINYIAHSGGGESLASILGGQVTAGVNSVSEFDGQIKSGALRPLAVSSETRLPNHPDVPTLRELGIDVTLLNWRGVMAGGKISDAERDALAKAVDDLARSDAWKEEVRTRAWVDMYQPREEFAAFLAAEQPKIETTLRSVGLVD